MAEKQRPCCARVATRMMRAQADLRVAANKAEKAHRRSQTARVEQYRAEIATLKKNLRQERLNAEEHAKTHENEED